MIALGAGGPTSWSGSHSALSSGGACSLVRTLCDQATQTTTPTIEDHVITTTNERTMRVVGDSQTYSDTSSKVQRTHESQPANQHRRPSSCRPEPPVVQNQSRGHVNEILVPDKVMAVTVESEIAPAQLNDWSDRAPWIALVPIRADLAVVPSHSAIP